MNRPTYIPPDNSWWIDMSPQQFTAHVLTEQWPRMRESKSASMLTGSESGATVSQWRPKLGGSGSGFGWDNG